MLCPASSFLAGSCWRSLLPPLLPARSTTIASGPVCIQYRASSTRAFSGWERTKASWTDVLPGSSLRADQFYKDWRQAVGGEPPVRTIEVMGYRVSWNEEDPDFPSEGDLGIRFGSMARLTASDSGYVEVVPRGQDGVTRGSARNGAGSWPVMRPAGWASDEIAVERPRGGSVELDWDELRSLEFAAVPNGAVADAVRLYGTVQDRDGARLHGLHLLEFPRVARFGYPRRLRRGRRRQRIPFGDVREVSKTMRGALVTMASGVEQELNRRTDAGRGHRGVGISDVCLGRVEVEWDDFRTLQLRQVAGNAAAGRSSFGPAYPLSGSVVTQADEKLAGRLRWNADKEWSWKPSQGPLGERGVRDRARSGSADRTRRSRWAPQSLWWTAGASNLGAPEIWGRHNRGVFVFSVRQREGGEPLERPSGERPWRYVPWEEFREARFEQPVSVCDSDKERS